MIVTNGVMYIISTICRTYDTEDFMSIRNKFFEVFPVKARKYISLTIEPTPVNDCIYDITFKVFVEKNYEAIYELQGVHICRALARAIKDVKVYNDKPVIQSYLTSCFEVEDCDTTEDKFTIYKEEPNDVGS